MYVGEVSKVVEEEVEMEGAKKVKIQWLITNKQGAENFAMRRFIMGKGGFIPKHKHGWEHEIFILKGKGKIGVENREVEVKKESFLFIPPNATHWFKNEGEEDFVFLCMIPYKKG